MQYLIDGYNLLHAIGWAPARGVSLQRSRLRLLDWLATELQDRVENVSAVFDSAQDWGGNETIHRGIHLRFSRGETADDLIEKIIRDEPLPAALTVVSNDHRLQQAARRRGCVSWNCGDLSRLDRRRQEEDGCQSSGSGRQAS